MAPQTRGGKGKGQKRQTEETTTTSKKPVMAPQPRGGKGKGQKRQTEETTTTSKKFKPRRWVLDVEEQLSDDDYVRERKERKTVMADCEKMKAKSKIESDREFKALITYLKKRGMPEDRTYEEAIHQLLGGDLTSTKKKLISNRIGKYIALKLTNFSRILIKLFGVCDWDSEVASLIIELTEDLKDLVVSFPELEEIASFAADVLKGDERWQVRLGEAMKGRVRLWLYNSMNEVEMMKKWAECPTSIIVSYKVGHRLFPTAYQ